MLARKNMSLKDIVKVLQGFQEKIGDGEPQEPSSNTAEHSSQDVQMQRGILQGLIDFLDSC